MTTSEIAVTFQNLSTFYANESKRFQVLSGVVSYDEDAPKNRSLDEFLMTATKACQLDINDTIISACVVRALPLTEVQTEPLELRFWARIRMTTMIRSNHVYNWQNWIVEFVEDVETGERYCKKISAEEKKKSLDNDLIGFKLKCTKKSHNADWMEKAFIPVYCANFLSTVPRGRSLKIQCYNVVRVVNDLCGFEWV